jgi:hypothetical protein
VYTYYDVHWERGSAYGNPRGDVITSPIGSRNKTVERRPAVYGEPLAVEVWNTGQISECCARFRIVYPADGAVYQPPADPRDDSYDAIFDRHNQLFGEDGRFLPDTDWAGVPVENRPSANWH